MPAPDWFRGKKITVMGLGTLGGGVGVATWLRRRGAIVTATDLRDEHLLASSVATLAASHARDAAAAKKRGLPAPHPIRYALGSHPEALFTDCDLVIQNPAVPRDSRLLALARKRGIPVETDMSIFFSLCPFPVTAVSGTRGKTTTALLVAAMASAHDKRTVIGGNLRVSPLDRLDDLLAFAARNARSRAPLPPPPIVLELSSWMLEGLEAHRASPRVAALTMIAPDHLNRYRDMDDYVRAKELLVAFQRDGDTAVLNAGNRWTAAIGKGEWKVKAAPHGGRVVWFGRAIPKGADACFVRGGWVTLRIGGKTERVLPLSSFKLHGEHNVENLLAAAATAHAAGIPLTAIRKAVRSFRSVPHRLEELRTVAGVRYVNDTAATSPDGSVAALETYAKLGKRGRVILLSGGADKKLEFGAWAKKVAAVTKAVVLFDGTATERISDALRAAKANVVLAGARSMAEAFAEARGHAKRGDVVLLSPGCASFGVFRNEFDRGDQFVKLVKRLK